MMKKFYSFAGVDLCVELPREKMYEDDRRLAAFRADVLADCHNFRFSLARELEAPQGECIHAGAALRVYQSGQEQTCYIGNVAGHWAEGYIRAEHRGCEHTVQLKAATFPGTVGTKTVLAAIGAEHLVAQAGGFILHASYVVWQGRGILFTAPSETGKSTQAELWRSLRGARIVNGDRAVVRMVDGEASAWGLPFAGSSTYCENVTAPLAAIVYLGQAPRTQIRKLRGYDAFRRVWEGVSVNTWDREDLALVSDTLTQVLGKVPVYCLECTPDESAVLALEQLL